MSLSSFPLYGEEAQSCQMSQKEKYISVFRENRSTATQVLAELYATNNPDILTFMSTFLWLDPTARELEYLWSSEFPQTLLDLITNRKWYEGFRAVVETEEYDFNTLAHAWQFLIAVECLGAFANIAFVRPDGKPMESFCHQFSKLWGLLWEYRKVVFSDALYNATRRDIAGIVELRTIYFLMWKNIQDSGPPLSTYLGHVTFFLWVNHDYATPASEGVAGSADVHAYVISSMIQAASDKHCHINSESVNAFFREVLPAVVGSMDIAEVIHRCLVRRFRLSASGYRHALDVVSHLVGSCPVTNDLRHSDTARILHAIATAIRHYECHGYIEGDENTAAEISTSFIDLYAAFCIHSVEEHDQEAMDAVIGHNVVHNPYEYNFVRSISQALLHVCRSNSHMCQEIISSIITGYGIVAKLGRTRPIRNFDHLRKYCYLRRVLQVHWLPTLNDLWAAYHQERRSTNGRSTFVNSLRDVINVWKELGDEFNLNDKSREYDLGLTNYLTEEEKRIGCFNVECQCYGQKPLQGFRRICKGCWSAFYCGKQCQKRDWDAGHKALCSR